MTPKERAIAARLRDIEQRDGSLKASAVVTDAQDPSSPMHDCFDWDDSVAAHKWRLRQARRLIRVTRREVIVDDAVVHRRISYVHDPDREDEGYVATLTLQDDRQRAIAALSVELRRIESAIERAKEVALAVGLDVEIERLVQAFQSLREREPAE